MKFANRVTLQGYLEVVRMEQVPLDNSSGLAAPVVHGWLWTGQSGLERHRVVIADKPAIGLLEVLRRFNPEAGGSALVSIDGHHYEVAHLDGKPFVVVEGTLTNGVVNVKFLTMLSTPEISLLRLLRDHRLRELVSGWEDLREADRAGIYRWFAEIRQARRPLGLSSSGQNAPDGAGWGGLSSSPPAGGRECAAPLGGGTASPPDLDAVLAEKNWSKT